MNDWGNWQVVIFATVLMLVVPVVVMVAVYRIETGGWLWRRPEESDRR